MAVIWETFTNFIFVVLKFLYGYIGDWGLSIIAITLVFRTLLIPLTAKQTKSAAQMQKIQPKIQELQAKYKDQPEVLQEKMGEFYKENKISPLGGCILPFLQMPIFVALFQVLRQLPLRLHLTETMPLPQIIDTLNNNPIPFTGIVPNLSLSAKTLWGIYSVSDSIFEHWQILLPYILLVALGGVSTILPQLLQKQTGAAASNMRIMVVVMGGMMVYFGWISPAGVLLYWVTSSLFGVVQQLYIQRKIKSEEEEAITVEPVSVKAKSKKPSKSSK